MWTELFPLDEQLGLPYHSLSPLWARPAVWLSSRLPYAQAEPVLARIGGYTLPATTLCEQTQPVGEKWLTEQQKQPVSIERTCWEQRHYQPQARRRVRMEGDGAWTWGRLERTESRGHWHGIAPWELDEASVSRSDDLRSTAYLGGVEGFAAAWWQLALQPQVAYAGQGVVTADGAAWNWRWAADLFPCSTHIVDGYPARPPGSALAPSHFPDAPDPARSWEHRLKPALWEGKGWHVIAQARAAGLPTGDFEQHQRRMDYPTFRAPGYPIGSSTTESGVKQSKHRFGAAGMRWSRRGGERMVVLRSAALEAAFDQRWAAA